MKKAVSFFSLFTSFGTLICCALPALFVVLGLGATLVSAVSAFPQLIWISENKELVFGIGALMISVAGVLQWRARQLSCSVVDAKLYEACSTTRDWSLGVYFVSLGLYLIGALFAFGAPLLNS